MPKIIGTAPNQVPVNGNLGNLAYQDAANIAGNVGVGGSVTATSGVINANTTTDALRITQTGTGNALLVEDSTNPDASPFVIDASGNTVVGATTPLTNLVLSATPKFQVIGGSSIAGIGIVRTDASGGSLSFNGGSSGNNLASGSVAGLITAGGYDGSNYIETGRIEFRVDGTPGTNDMPGRLVFSTTADGASSPTERMRIRSDGTVGIGTASPVARLHISAAAASSGEDLLKLQNGADAAELVVDTAANVVRVLTGSGDALVLGTSSTEAMRIDSSGNVGIGTTAPSEKLTVNGSIDLPTINTYIKGGGHNVLQVDATRTYFYGGTSGVQFRTADNASALVDITNSGNVGIGTSSPGQKLDVAGNVGASGVVLGSYGVVQCTNSTTGLSLLGGNQVNGANSGGQINLRGTVENRIEFLRSGNVETARIDSSGNLLVGTTSAVSGGGVLQVSNGITFPATQSASANANTLDDYEEGTWNPSAGGNATYTTQTGTYTKVGNIVTAWFDIQINVLGTGSATNFGGLPYVSRISPSNPQGMAGSVGYFVNIATASTLILVRIDNNSTTCSLSNTAGVTSNVLNNPIFGNSARITGTITYQANA